MEKATTSDAHVQGKSCGVEFVVNRGRVLKMRTGLPKIQVLFNATVQFGKISPKASKDGEPQQWISLNAASEEEVMGAKDYILALTSPELTMTVEYGQTLKTLSHDDHLDIERQTHAVVRQQDGKLEISGDELSVVMAQSMIDAVCSSSLKSEKDCIVIDSDNDELDCNNSSLYPVVNRSMFNSPAHNPPVHNLFGVAVDKQYPHPYQPAMLPIQFPKSYHPTMSPMDTEDIPRSTLLQMPSHHALSIPTSCQSGRSSVGDSRLFYPAGASSQPSSGQTSQPAASSSQPVPVRTGGTSPQGRQQWSYLRNVGLSCNYSEDDVLTALAQFDMEEIVVPSHFLGMLKEIKAARHGVGAHNETAENNSELSGGKKTGHITSEQLVADNLVVISDEENDTLPKPLVYPTHGMNSAPQKNSPSSLESHAAGPKMATRPKSREEMVPKTFMGSGDATGHNTQRAGDSNLRYIVIDGSNVAMCHGDNKVFSARGLEICINFFKARGHPNILAFVSESYRYSGCPVYLKSRQTLEKLNQEGYVKYTPARRVNGKHISSYEDRFTLNLAMKEDAVVVSNDQFRDLCLENPKYLHIVEKRLLQFVFAGDHFMPPDDPLGRNGPSLDQFLSKTNTSKASKPVPYNQFSHKGHRPVPPKNPFPWPAMMGDQGHKRVAPKRSLEETEKLFVELVQIFPEPSQQTCVKTVLNNHIEETDINKLTNFCINALCL